MSVSSIFFRTKVKGKVIFRHEKWISLSSIKVYHILSEETIQIVCHRLMIILVFKSNLQEQKQQQYNVYIDLQYNTIHTRYILSCHSCK